MVEEINIVVSDFQMGEGIGAPLEDFLEDRHFADFLVLLRRQTLPETVLHLRLLGDILDPLIVRYRGAYLAPETEEVCLAKFEKILEGHPVVFDALADFLRRDNTLLTFYTGNHDLFLEWPSVRARLVERLAQGSVPVAAKIRFVGAEQDFREVHRGVLYEHGNYGQYSTRVPPSRPFVWSDDLFHLNSPVGSYKSMRLVNALKLRNPAIDRMHYEPAVWLYSARYRLDWVPYAAYQLVASFLHCRFRAFKDCRRKVGFWRTIALVLGTLSGYHAVDRYGKKLLERFSPHGVHTVIFGHTHTCRDEVTPQGRYLNSGGWALRYRLVWPHDRHDPLRWLFAGRPNLVPCTRLTFVRVQHDADGTTLTNLLEYVPQTKSTQAYVPSRAAR